MDIVRKILEIAIGEIIIALIFIFLIIMFSEIKEIMPNNQIDIIPMLYILWAISGLGTPFVILLLFKE